MRLSSICLSVLLVGLLLGCSTSTEDSGKLDTLSFNAASKSTLYAAKGTLGSLKIYQALLISAQSAPAERDIEREWKELTGSFPLPDNELIAELDGFLKMAQPIISPERYTRLLSLRDQLAHIFSDLKQTGKMPAARGMRGAARFGALGSAWDILLGGIVEAIDLLGEIAGIVEAIPAPLPPAAGPPIDPFTGGRSFGPTNCPAIRNHYPNGWVPEGPFTPCGDFAQLRECMRNEKEKACEERCDPNNPPAGENCNVLPARGEVEEIRCENPPAEYAALCAAAGNSRAVCDGNATNSFPVGFFICKNPSSFKLNPLPFASPIPSP